MRDLVFVLAMLPLVFFALKRPFISASLWLWSGLFVPPHWLSGIGLSISINTLFAAITILGYVFNSHNKKLSYSFPLLVLVIFFFHNLVSTAFSGGVPELLWIEWEKYLKIMLCCFLIILIFREKHHFELLCWALVLSVGFYGAVEGLKFLMSGGAHKISGPRGHIMGDNNHLAAAMCMILPLIYYLFRSEQKRLIKWALLACAAVCVFTILGTHSRGGLLGLLVVGGYFWLKSNKKILSLVFIIMIGSVAVSYLPDQWFERMETIENATEDSSFAGRLVSWKIHTLMALENPVFGGGYKTTYYKYNWESLGNNIHIFDFIPTPPPSESPKAAHSIYFQVLGDLGFIGLILFLLIFSSCYFSLFGVIKNVKSQKGQEAKNNSWQKDLASMLQLSLVAYGTAGAALSLAFFELAWAIVGVVIALLITTHLQQEKAELEVNTVNKQADNIKNDNLRGE